MAKVNSDGAIFSREQKSGIGAVIRDVQVGVEARAAARGGLMYLGA